jgi:hypothetical protein
MNTTIRCAALLLAVMPVAARAQAIPAVCKPLLDAERKEIVTPHHTYPAAVYTSHNESEDLKADARVWVARKAGVVLRREEDMDAGDAGKRYISIRYEYANVHAPTGAK